MGSVAGIPLATMPKLVMIEWLDSHHIPRWTVDDPVTEPLLCRSVGWLVHDGDKAKTIAPHMTDEETPQRAGEMTIPACAVKRIKVLVKSVDAPKQQSVADTLKELRAAGGRDWDAIDDPQAFLAD